MTTETQIVLADDEVAAAVQLLKNGHRLLFTGKDRRGQVAKAAKLAGLKTYRSSTRNQQLDPRYTFEGRNIPDRGLGNDYRRFHSCLYELTTDPRRW